MADVNQTVQRAYGEIAAEGAAGSEAAAVSRSFGYTADDLAAVPDGANLGLGCGNPLAWSDARPGEVVLDLGSGGGFDCFLAAQRVGPAGRVIGVDLSPEMIDRARRNAAAGGFANVEFRLGDLVDLPVADGAVDVVISNCVISLVPDRLAVYREARRVLRSGGRLAVSDTLVTAPLPDSVMAVARACFGLGTTAEYVRLVTAAGFADVRVVAEEPMPPDRAFEDAVAAALSDDLGVPREVIETAAGSMISVGVTGVTSG